MLLIMGRKSENRNEKLNYNIHVLSLARIIGKRICLETFIVIYLYKTSVKYWSHNPWLKWSYLDFAKPQENNHQILIFIEVLNKWFFTKTTKTLVFLQRVLSLVMKTLLKDKHLLFDSSFLKINIKIKIEIK